MAERLFDHLTIDGDEAKLDGAVIKNLENNEEFSELKSGLNKKLDAPQTAGTNGQVLTSNGHGGQSWQNPSGGEGGGAGLEEITYAELKAKRDGGQLTQGGQYRITDYVCTTTQEESRAVSHPFDIIVVADSESILNENARACLHDGDDYYSAQGYQADLEAWELKYCIDNDDNRFAWADAVNGKGVIYYMKDDRNNECPYDFKQIQFKRYPITECVKVPSLVGKYTALIRSGDITGIDEQNPVWCYTFSVMDWDDTSVIYDGSIAPLSDDTEDHGCSVLDNKISSLLNYKNLERGLGQKILYLNNIVFTCYLAGGCRSNTFGSDCESNTFGDQCEFNTFGYYCKYNTFGVYFLHNTFGDTGMSNTFGDRCDSNTFGDYCQENTFGDDCCYNTFGNNDRSNTFGAGFYHNTFRNSCQQNTFGNSCRYNTFGNWYQFNTFGKQCQYNTFGNDCESNTFGDYCESNTFGNHCWYVDLAAGSSSTNAKQYYHVLDGVRGTRNSHISITGTNKNNFETNVGMNSSGILKTWTPADLAP